MALPEAKTKQGFEFQFGVNHVGHFVFTSEVMPLLRKSEAARVVVVSSSFHKFGALDFEQIDGRKGYKRWMNYG